MDKNFEIEICGLGNNITGYPGGFTPVIDKILKETIKANGRGKILHLFSGVSTIGDERIDLGTVEATKRIDVLSFIEKDNRFWNWIILDPPYEIKRKSKIEEYSRNSSVAADVQLRTALLEYFKNHTNNILWLDMCAPLPDGFKREKLWFLFPGGYHTLRILNWLKRERLAQEILL